MLGKKYIIFVALKSCGSFDKAFIGLMYSAQIGFHWICIASLIDLEKILAVEKKDFLKNEENPQEMPTFLEVPLLIPQLGVLY